MGKTVSRSIYSIIITLFGSILGVLSIGLSMKLFNEEQLGLQQSFVKIGTTIVYFLILGFDYTLLVWGQRFDNNNPKRKSFLRFTATIPVILVSLFIVLYYLLKGSILGSVSGDDKYYFEQNYHVYPLMWISYTALFWILGYLKSIEKSVMAFFINEVLIRILLVILIILYAFKIVSFDLYISCYIAVFFIVCLVGVLQIIKQKRSSFHKNNIKKESLDKNEKKEILWYSIYHMPVFLATMLILQVESIILPFVADNALKSIAVYSVCIYIVSIIKVPLRVLGQTLLPSMTREYDLGDMQAVKQNYIRIANVLQLITAILVGLMMININDIQLIINEYLVGYQLIHILLPILLIGVVIEMSMGLSLELLGVSKYYKSGFYISLFAILFTITCFYYLINNWGVLGAAWAFTISLVCYTLIKNSVVYYRFNIIPLNKITLFIALISIILVFILYKINVLDNVYLNVLIKSLIYLTIFYVISKYLYIFRDIDFNLKKTKKQ